MIFTPEQRNDLEGQSDGAACLGTSLVHPGQTARGPLLFVGVPKQVGGTITKTINNLNFQ